MSEADLRALFGVRREEARVLLDMSLYNDHAALLDEFNALQGSGKGSIADGAEGERLAQRLVELEDRMDAAEIVLVFQGIGSTAWLKLGAEHPPTPAERLAGHVVDDATFRPAATVASCVEARNLPDGIEFSLELATMMYELLPMSEVEHIWDAVHAVNVGGGRPKSLIASVTRRQSDGSLATASPTGSPEASSSDESSGPESRTG